MPSKFALAAVAYSHSGGLASDDEAAVRIAQGQSNDSHVAAAVRLYPQRHPHVYFAVFAKMGRGSRGPLPNVYFAVCGANGTQLQYSHCYKVS